MRGLFSVRNSHRRGAKLALARFGGSDCDSGRRGFESHQPPHPNANRINNLGHAGFAWAGWAFSEIPTAIPTAGIDHPKTRKAPPAEARGANAWAGSGRHGPLRPGGNYRALSLRTIGLLGQRRRTALVVRAGDFDQLVQQRAHVSVLCEWRQGWATCHHQRARAVYRRGLHWRGARRQEVACSRDI